MKSDCDSRQIVPSAIVKAKTRPVHVLTIAVVCQAGNWTKIGIENATVMACASALTNSSAWPFREAVSATVALSTNAHVQQLNKTWRNKDQPTNVLSFPSQPSTRDETGLYIGDVILALETIQAEAHELEITLADHFKHLIIHGLLHLLGFDHETDTDAEAMEQLETKILATLGVADPYGDERAPKAQPEPNDPPEKA
jgi:probable rRNA maturation factor